jgi:hypothetical protein
VAPRTGTGAAAHAGACTATKYNEG